MWPLNQEKKKIHLEGRECNRVVCCSTRVGRLRLSELWSDGQIAQRLKSRRGGGGPQRWDFVLSIALKSGLLAGRRSRKKVRGGKMFPHFSLSVSVRPPEQTTGSHRTEFVFDVRQFGVLQRAQLHFSTPPPPVLYREQLKTTSKKSHKERKQGENKRKSKTKQSYSPPNRQF